jgi:hypothetical protein
MEDKYNIACRILLDRRGEILRTIGKCNEVKEYNALKDEENYLDDAILSLSQAERAYKSFN